MQLKCIAGQSSKHQAADLVTWLFDPESFAPIAKLTSQACYDIISDHLGTPLSMHQASGEAVWAADLDSYGQVQNLRGKAEDCPFRFPGQYEDVETGLYYNRFRYYDAREGMYVSQDPIGLNSSQPNFYAYVHDPNVWMDKFGLDCLKDDLRKAANLPDIKDPRFTKAGRSLTKHGTGARTGNSVFPVPRGNPDGINKQAADLVDDLLENGTIITRPGKGGVDILQVNKPNGAGMIFKSDGSSWNFSHFAENLF
jgi:RHS repeat-associated protein